ncbi:MAG TPA: ABC transporter substrate-binding protein [Candidatus Acidoferrales bacterium]|nr:ABC transporter substrate-binding protein [Candidatus Acidoferrales bacterium]
MHKSGPALLLLPILLASATRPRYGGTLHVEIRSSIETPDPPNAGSGIPDLSPAFHITRWEAGRRAIFESTETVPGGRPFLDSVEVTMGRALRDQSIDLELGKADLIELGPSEIRRQPPARKVWSSSPVRVLALVFGKLVDDARVREALALAVDRSAIQAVLLQRQGEVSAALLPQWLSGFAFLYPTATDIARARSLASGARPLALAVDDPSLRPIAERIALNARDAGLTLAIGHGSDVRLVELRVASLDPVRALAAMAVELGLPEPAHADSPEALYLAERALLQGHRVIPLIHLPDVYGAGPRVHGGPGVTPLGEWRFENLWLEGGRP